MKNDIHEDILFSSSKFVKQRMYWYQAMKDQQGHTYLIHDYSNQLEAEYEMVEFYMPQALVEKVNKISKNSDLATYVYMLSCLNVLINKLTGETEIIVNIPTYNFKADQHIYNEYLPVITCVNVERSFKEFLIAVKSKVLEVYDNQNYPLDKVFTEVSDRGTLNLYTLSDITFCMANIHSCQKNSLHTGFNLILEKIGESLKVNVLYNRHLFKKEHIDLYLQYYFRIIEIVFNNLEIRIEDIKLIIEKEKETILYEFNNTSTSYPSDKSIHAIFEEQVKSCAKEVAIVYNDEIITYEDLNNRANQVAWMLKEKKVIRNQVIGIVASKSTELIAGILGILKAGGAYLPINPEYPEERISYMLTDANVQIVLSNSDFSLIKSGVEIIHLNSSCAQAYNNPEVINEVDDLAYVIYTSGTTGCPKGVMVEHRNVVRLVKGQKYVDFKQGDKILQTGSVAFDASTFEIFGALLNGLSLYIVEELSILEGDKLAKMIKDNGITTMWLTSPLFSQLAMENSRIFTGLKFLLVGGDVLNPLHIQQVRECCEDVIIINGYGPTENTTFSTTYQIDAVTTARIPVGKPLNNSTTYIMDEKLQLLPPGVIGELYVGGKGVARGYLNRSELTKEKFVKNPYTGERLYKTGDMARWLIDGNIEYIGRKDNQVKIRGFRIEIAEVEDALLKLEDIREAVVVARGEGNLKYLCAYYVAETEKNVGVLREQLKKIIPEYMIPMYFAQIEKIPLNQNGKVDRRSLPQISYTTISSQEHTLPRNDLERKLAEVWATVLEIDAEKIGIYDNFFEIGGHSLKATVLAAKIHKALNVRLPLTEVFEHATIEELAIKIESLKIEKHQEIVKTEEKESYKVSSAQKRMYVLNEINQSDISYNIPLILHIEGDLDKDKLIHTLRSLVERHESLRTYFVMEGEELVQKIEKDAIIEVEYLQTQGEIEESLRAYIRPFDLAKAPLIRAGLLELTEKEHILAFDMHHIISDGVSLGILAEDFTNLYSGKPIEEMRLQYKDYAEWQRKAIANDEFKQQEEYWLNEFAEGVPELNLMTDFPRPEVKTFEGDNVSFEIDAGLTQKLIELANKHRTTLYTVLLAAFHVLLNKYSRQEEFVVGTPVANRRHADLEKMVGMFVNTLAIKSTIIPGEEFDQYIERVREKTLLAFENQDYQFEELVEKLQLDRNVGRNPLFDVMLILQNFDRTLLNLDMLTIREYKYCGDVAKFDLILGTIEKGDRLCFNLEYATKLFMKKTIQKMGSHFVNILQTIADNSSIQIKDIEMITDTEKSRLLEISMETECLYPVKTINQMFVEQVEKMPDAQAVISQEEVITYRELHRRSNAVANTLREKGVVEEEIVAIMMDRSIEMVVGILGVLKSGAAYLPIDPRDPEGRIKYVLEDSGVKLVLVTDEQRLPVETINILQAMVKGTTKNPETYNKPENLAYVIYTSGSTGKPKGAMIEHHSLVNRLNWMDKHYPLGSEDTILQKTVYTFDVSVWELLWWAVKGAKVSLLAKGGEKDPDEIVREIERNNVTVIHFVPSMFNAFLNYLRETHLGSKLSSLKQVFVSGEVLRAKQVNMFFELIGDCHGTRLTNLYGPTEATIDVTYYICSGNETDIPIGKPIDNTGIYIFDDNLKLCPEGIIGELCIGGVGLARGYVNNQELTNEKFIVNPYTKELMYKSGDLARWSNNGYLEYYGRKDFQVKLRGYRIETGEIENALMEIKGVKEVVVIARGEGEDKYLCAYYTFAEEKTSQELKEELRSRLPEHMIPTYFVPMEQLPLTGSGKVDRKAFPDPDRQANCEEQYEAPVNETEKELIAIWENILGVTGIGRNDNFFEIGGHSLKAMLLAQIIQKHFGIEFPLMEIVKNPRIRDLAQCLLEQTDTKEVTIFPVAKQDYYETSSVQRRLYFLQQIKKDNTGYNVPYVLYINGKLDVQRLEESIKQMIHRHESFRTAFVLKEDVPVQLIYDEVPFTINYTEADENQAKKIIHSFVQPFDLSQPPLLRVALIKLEAERYIIAIDMHHIITDGISGNIFINELLVTYHGGQLQSLKLQYKDYVAWQNSEEQQQKLAGQEKYWLEQFARDIPVLNLPVDFARPKEKTFKGKSKKFLLTEDTTAKLNQLIKNENVTQFIALLAIYYIWLSKLSGQVDIVVGTSIAGRKHADLYNTIGMFINALALRTTIDGEKTYKEFLKEVKETTFQGFENQDYLFETLVEKLGLKRDPSRNSLFDVMFVLNNEGTLNLDIPKVENSEINFEPYPIEHQATQVDIKLRAMEIKGEIHFLIEYSVDLFKDETIEMFIEKFKEITNLIVENIDIRIRDIVFDFEINNIILDQSLVVESEFVF